MEEFYDDDDESGKSGPSYWGVERILKLVHLLHANSCTQIEIFEHLRDYYPTDTERGHKKRSSRKGPRKLERDLNFLEVMGYEVKRKQEMGGVVRYSIQKGSGPVSPFLFGDEELALLATLYTLFVDPMQPLDLKSQELLSQRGWRHPLAAEILGLIERFTGALSLEQKRRFESFVRKPLLYFNLEAVTEYGAHKATMEKILKAIGLQRQISFEYQPHPPPRSATQHKRVDPYYLVQQEGHVYLVGYSYDAVSTYKNRVFEWRVDRIKGESVQFERDPVSSVRERPRLIVFKYWADESIVRGELSQRWVKCEIEDEKMVGEGTLRRRWFLVRAEASNEWRIIQQLHKYADKVQLVEPEGLVERMREEVRRTYELYFEGGGG